MQTSSAPAAAAETDAASVRLNLFALNLAIELARGAGARGTATLAGLGPCDWGELLDDELQQLGGGQGLRQAVEELQRALQQAGELGLRSTESAPGEPVHAEAIGER
jgi:hypothetical protein